MNSNDRGIVNDGSRKLEAGTLNPISGKLIEGVDTVEGKSRSLDVWPPSGRGSEITTLSLLNWYLNKVSLLREEDT